MTRLRSLAVALLLMEVVMQVPPLRPASAAPIVELKSHSKLQLDGVRRDGEMVIVTGRLYDPQTSLGLADSAVEIVVAGVPVTVETDADGRFAVAVSAPPGQQTIEMKFSGNGSLDEAALTEVADPELSPVSLSFEARPTPTGVELTVTAQSGPSTSGSTFDAPLVLYVDRPGSEEMKELARATAGVPIALTRKQLGGAGTRRFRADFAGDAAHQPATVTGTYELTSSSKTTLALDGKELAYEDTLTASGAITDEDGTGLAGAAVTLVAGDRRLAQGVSGADGRYRFRVEGEILGAGTYGLQTLAEPGGAIALSRSEPVTVKVSPPQPVPITYTVLTFLATGLAAAAFFLARTKPWKRFAKDAPPSQQVVVNAEAQQGGLVVNKPSLVSTLRRASDHGFSGAVRDTVRGRPVAGAAVLVRRRGAAPSAAPDVGGADGPLDLTVVDAYRTVSGEDGTFTLEDLGPGDWMVSVSAVSHITEAFPIGVPHRGELRGVRVDLVPVREKVFLLYQRAAMPVLPDPKLWGVWSPRQVVDHVRATRPSPALAKLTDFVEEVYFSARPIEETILPAARQRVEAAIAERAGPPPA
jgi:hypothetical protein